MATLRDHAHRKVVEIARLPGGGIVRRYRSFRAWAGPHLLDKVEFRHTFKCSSSFHVGSIYRLAPFIRTQIEFRSKGLKASIPVDPTVSILVRFSSVWSSWRRRTVTIGIVIPIVLPKLACDERCITMQIEHISNDVLR